MEAEDKTDFLNRLQLVTHDLQRVVIQIRQDDPAGASRSLDIVINDLEDLNAELAIAAT